MATIRNNENGELKTISDSDVIPKGWTYHSMKDQEAKKPEDTPYCRMPTEAKERKTYPVATGVVDYFPDALVEIAHVSWQGNQQHHPEKPLHWDRSKSTDEADALMRHFLQRGLKDNDGIRHTAKMAWRALALLQKELEGV